MLMPITYAEKNLFSKNAQEIVVELLDNSYDNSVLLFKVLAHSVQNNATLVQSLDESIFENTEVFKEQFSNLLQHALTQAYNHKQVVTEPTKDYSIKELSKYFGVSVVSIHNWLDQGRFEGIERAGDHKHNRIPGDTLYVTTTGRKLRIIDVIKMWEQQELELEREHQHEDNLSYYTRQIAMFEQKYNGEYEATLGTQNELTPEEETDAQVWKHLLRRQTLEFRNSKE